MKFNIITFGCKVNQYESNMMKENMLSSNFFYTEDLSDANIIIVNTCSVTNVADKKCLKMIRRLKREYSNAILVVAGCSSQNKQSVYESLDIDILIGNRDKSIIDKLIKEYIETKFGYDLDVKLETIRPGYSFDVTCQGSVPIAIMSFLQRENTEGVLRLAISMGGDSDTIGCMACAISMAGIYRKEYSLDATQKELIKHCETLLPEDLLKINDRFEALIRTNRINED